METLTQFLIDWGYWGLFFSALIAGSVVPFSSEAVMLVLVHMGLDLVLCVVSAASGNTCLLYTSIKSQEFFWTNPK